MPKKIKKREADEEWTLGPSKRPPKNKTESHCIIHCTDSSDELVLLPSTESWKSLLEAARVRQNYDINSPRSNRIYE